MGYWGDRELSPVRVGSRSLCIRGSVRLSVGLSVTKRFRQDPRIEMLRTHRVAPRGLFLFQIRFASEMYGYKYEQIMAFLALFDVGLSSEYYLFFRDQILAVV